MKPLEQAAREYVDSMATRYPEDAMEDFMEGAKWREEQAASGFQEWESKLNEYEKYDFDIFSGLKAWQAAQLSSAKLLAEKDAEIERLKAVILEMSEGLKLVSFAANYLDETLANVKWEIDDFNRPCDPEWYIWRDLVSARETLLKHAALIEAIKGEE